MKVKTPHLERLIAYINRKAWWHVPPRDPTSYSKRGKFFASSFREAEFWGRPLDEPKRVAVTNPLLGDEETVEKTLFGRRISRDDFEMEERWKLDAKMKRAALAKGYDCILVMTPRAFNRLRISGKLPRSIELNVLSSTSEKRVG